jgi:hypothetical protein
MVWQPFITPYAPEEVERSKEEKKYFISDLSFKLKFIGKVKYFRD